MGAFDPLRTFAASRYQARVRKKEPPSAKSAAPPWVMLHVLGAIIFVGGLLLDVFSSPYLPGFLVLLMAYGAFSFWLFLRHYRVTRR